MECERNPLPVQIESPPKISIITATYNRSEVLRWAIRSILAQTVSDWELIIVGDACTDDTPNVVASFGDPRIRFVNREVSFREQSGPNNDGFFLAKGKLIAYLNHDDLWFPDHLESLVKCLEDTKADLVYALPLTIDTNQIPFCGVSNQELRYDPSHFVPASLWLLRRELIEELDRWRPAHLIQIRNPSQDFLFRAWKLQKRLHCHPRFTAIIIPSCSKPNAYLTRKDDQHREISERMRDPSFREQLATTLARNATETLKHLTYLSWKSRLRRLFERIAIRLKIHPDAAMNMLLLRRKGWWIDYLRKFRGLD